MLHINAAAAQNGAETTSEQMLMELVLCRTLATIIGKRYKSAAVSIHLTTRLALGLGR